MDDYPRKLGLALGAMVGGGMMRFGILQRSDSMLFLGALLAVACLFALVFLVADYRIR